MTGQELVDQAKLHNNQVVTTTYDDAWYLDRVNDAYRWITTYRNPQTGKKLRYRELYDVLDRTLSASPSRNFVANQSSVHAVHSIYDVTNLTLIPEKSPTTIERRDPTALGTIIMWAPAGDDGSDGYLIWRRNEDAVDIRESVYKIPTALTLLTSPVIPERWHELIAIDAGRRAARLSNNFQLSALLKAELLDEIESSVSPLEEAGRNGARYHFIGRRW